MKRFLNLNFDEETCFNSLPLSSSHVSDHHIRFLYIYNNIVVSVDCLRIYKKTPKPFSLTNTSPALCFCCSLSMGGFCLWVAPHISEQSEQAANEWA